MNAPDITLTPAEQKLFAAIEFDRGRHDGRIDDYETTQRNGETAAALMKSLLANKSIPEVRLKYFTDPEYNVGRVKGSHRDIFHRNRNTDEELVRHEHFLPYLRYFVCGPDLPVEAIRRFREEVKDCGQVTSSDIMPLSKSARTDARKFGLVAHEAAEEYFKLALDCSLWISYALAIRKSVLSIR